MANPIENGKINETDRHVYQGSRWWVSNAWGATYAGIGGALFMIAIAITLFVLSEESHRVDLLTSFLILNAVLGLVWYFPGNGIATYPYSVEIEKGKGIYINAPFKRLFIPLEHIREVRRSFLGGGTVVYFDKRYGLIKKIVISYFFGSEQKPLTEALMREVGSKT